MERIERLAKAIAETNWTGETVEEILASVEDLSTGSAIETLENQLLEIEACAWYAEHCED